MITLFGGMSKIILSKISMVQHMLGRSADYCPIMSSAANDITLQMGNMWSVIVQNASFSMTDIIHIEYINLVCIISVCQLYEDILILVIIPLSCHFMLDHFLKIVSD